SWNPGWGSRTGRRQNLRWIGAPPAHGAAAENAYWRVNMKTFALASLVALAVVPVVDKPPVFKEWKVPWERTRPRDPYLDQTTGRIYFCGQTGDYIGYLVPETGEFKRSEEHTSELQSRLD